MIFLLKKQFYFVVLALSICLGLNVSAHAVERELYLETDCDAAGYVKAAGLGQNCFEDLDALNTFLWHSGNNPTETDPAVVNVGRGSFSGEGVYTYTSVFGGGLSQVFITAEGALDCIGSNGNTGWTTFRGKGRNVSILKATMSGTEDLNQSGDPADIATSLVFSADGCDGIAFDNLSFRDNGVGIHWLNGGDSVYTDIDIVSRLHAWAEDPNNCTVIEGEHYFYGSKLISNGSTYYPGCTRTWFYGGEIVVEPNGTFTPVGGGSIMALQMSGISDIRIFGSAVRMNGVDHNGVGNLRVIWSGGLESSTRTQIHMHGGILSGTTVGAAVDITGAHISQNAFLHIVDTAWALEADSGNTVTRLYDQGTNTVIQAPFLWPSEDAPPVPSTNSFTSISGQDVYVESDCSSSSCTGGSDPHMMVYSSACTGAGGPWFDTVTGACRVN